MAQTPELRLEQKLDPLAAAETEMIAALKGKRVYLTIADPDLKSVYGRLTNHGTNFVELEDAMEPDRFVTPGEMALLTGRVKPQFAMGMRIRRYASLLVNKAGIQTIFALYTSSQDALSQDELRLYPGLRDSPF